MQSAHFADLAPERHRELRARMAFLVMRGSLPDVAYHVANDGMVLDEAENDSEIPIDWDVVRGVADAWPDPARDPQARPVAGVFELARHVVGFVEATVEVPGDADANREQLSGLCLGPRMRRETLKLFEAMLAARAPVAAPEEPEPEDEQGWHGAPVDDDGWGHDSF